MKTASVSELKDRLSAHLEVVKAGEPVLVTDRRRPVAVLQPVAPGGIEAADLQGLLVAGAVTLPERSLDVRAFLKHPQAVATGGLGKALDEEREGR